MFRRLMVLPCLLACASAFADVSVRSCTIVISKGASPEETFAAHELCDYLIQISGRQIPIMPETAHVPHDAIVVGSGPLAHRLAPGAKWDGLGPEQTLIH